MTVTERSRRRVRDALDRLKRAFGRFDVVEKTWEQAPETYEWTRDRFAAGTLGGAGAWVRNDAGDVLLVRETDESAWSEPAGKHEPGETLEATARRETREECGVDCEVVDVRLVQHVTHADALDPDRPPVHRLIVTFDAEYVSGEVRPREGEIAEARWWSERPDELLYSELAGFPIPVERC